MVIVEREGLEAAVKQLLRKEWYKPVRVYDYSLVWEEYVDACKAISIGNFNLRRALLSDASLGDGKVCAKLSYNVKSHKLNGQVELRPIHSFLNSPMAPGMRFLASKLDEKLAKIPHLLRDANDLQKRLRSFKVPQGSRCIKLDVKDFFLTGSHEHLVSRSSSILDPSDREDYRVLARTILHNQYFSGPLVPGTFKVQCGTRMGMIPSGAISDSVLYVNLKKDLSQKLVFVASTTFSFTHAIVMISL